MGLFVSVSGVIGVGLTGVEKALAKQVKLKRGIFQAEARSAGDDDTMVLLTKRGNTTVFFPANDMSWWETSQALSRFLKTAVFAFHIHDSDLWMYELYQEGRKIDSFNPIPDYWMELSEEERQSFAGNAQKVAGCVPGLTAARIKKYLATWDPKAREKSKAYPSDKYAYGDEWQLLDFMRKLKLPYPLDAKGKALGPTYEFIIPPPKQS